MKSNQFDFIHYTEITFLSKTQYSLTCAEYVVLFSVFHDVRTKTSMSCQELFDSVHLHSIEKVETRNFNFYLNRIKV